MRWFKQLNLNGDLFATTFCYLAQGIIKFASSMILTRIVHPEAYGTITILLSIAFVVELLADFNVTLFIVRDKESDQPRYLHTAWTLRFARAILNSAIVFLFAPLIASSLYHLPDLVNPLRVFSVWFVIGGLESMSFPVAIRRQRTRLVVYSELAASFLATGFSLVYSYFSHDYWGMLYGTLLNRVLMTAFSYQIFPDLRPRLRLDWPAAREILQFTRFTMPSSLLTLGLSQFDKIAFLRFFNLGLLGVYGLATNFTNLVESLISKNSQLVLYPRCAHNFRLDPSTASYKYYSENVKLFAGNLLLPAAVGGAAHLIIQVLYPSQYAFAGAILQALMVRSALMSLASPAEDLLIASGESQVILVGNILRAIAILVSSLTGYFLFGFMGFIYGIALAALPPLLYYWWLQNKKDMLIVRYELYKIGFLFGIAASTFVASSIFLRFWPTARLRF